MRCADPLSQFDQCSDEFKFDDDLNDPLLLDSRFSDFDGKRRRKKKSKKAIDCLA